jgi:hypothetical protein
MLDWRRACGIYALILMGCGDDAATSGVGGRPSSGNLGQVAVSPECGALSQACIGQGLNAPLALGSRVSISVHHQIAGSSGPPTVLETANEKVLLPDDTALHAVGEGMSGVLFVGPQAKVIDFIHVWVQAADELAIHRYSESGALLGQVQPTATLLSGDELLVAVEPRAGGQPLLGNFELETTIEGTSVAIVPDPVAGWYRVIAKSAGDSTISFQGLGVEVDWSIEVLP